jgi:CheY-like chemotaxis protein
MRERPLVLTVDDNQGFLGKLAVLLERLHCDVLPVTSARDTIELARVARPRVIILNLQLACIDSLVFLRKLRADGDLADIPVVMFTDVREKCRVWEAMSLGCIEVLDKPLELDKLHQALQRCNLYPHAQRRYLRAPYARTVELLVDGAGQVVNALTLSERGIMVRMPQPLPKDTTVDVRITLPDSQTMQVGGKVIYVHDHSATPVMSANVAIKFDRLTLDNVENLQILVKQLLIGDLTAGLGEEPVIKPD